MLRNLCLRNPVSGRVGDRTEAQTETDCCSASHASLRRCRPSRCLPRCSGYCALPARRIAAAIWRMLA